MEYDEQRPHPDALRNFGEARVPESKIRYPLRDPDKSKAFEALGFSEGAGNWETLRGEIVGNLPLYPARFSHRDEWGTTYDVDMSVAGAEEKKAPVRTKWIFRFGEDLPRLVTFYVKTTEWRRWEREEDS